MKKVLAFAFMLLASVFAASSADAAGTVAFTSQEVPGTDVRVITFTATGDASDGSYPSNVDAEVNGYVFLVITNPGTTGPTASYDIVLNDADGLDVAGGMLANRSATATEIVIPKVDTVNGIYGPRFVKGNITPVITNNSVNSAVTVISVYVTK